MHILMHSRSTQRALLQANEFQSFRGMHLLGMQLGALAALHVHMLLHYSNNARRGRLTCMTCMMCAWGSSKRISSACSRSYRWKIVKVNIYSPGIKYRCCSCCLGLDSTAWSHLLAPFPLCGSRSSPCIYIHLSLLLVAAGPAYMLCPSLLV